MRRFAIGTMLVLGLAAGCEKPVEGIPSSAGSGVSAGDDLSVEMPVEDQAPPAGDAVAPPAEDAVPPATEPAPATEPEPAPSTEPAPAPDAVPNTDEPKAGEAAPATETPKQSSTGGSAAKFVTASLKVPTMSCPHGCWPTVKETLAAQPGVESVELAKQANADAIDNPVVHVKLNGKFDSKAAVAALAKAGFENAVVVK